MTKTRLKRCPHPDCHELIPLDAIDCGKQAGCARRESRKKVKRKEPQSASGKWKVAQREKDRLASVVVKPAETVTVQVNQELLAMRRMRGAIVDRIY